MRNSLLAICLLASASAAFGQVERKANEGPWFGVPMPSRFGSDPAVIVGERVRPAATPEAERRFVELSGVEIRKDLETIVGFSKQSRESKEIGSGQLWGRVSGFPSSARTIEWAANRFRSAGISDVKLQPIDQEGRANLWVPLTWEVRVLGDPSFGTGTSDVVLESAMPLAPSSIASGALTAELVYVGAANTAATRTIDVRGKIAVQLIVPQGHTLFERGTVQARAKSLFERGAVAVLNLVRLPGNERTFDFGNCGGPCFNIGGRDGWFLENVLDRAAQGATPKAVRAHLELKSETRNGLKAVNAVAVVPGASPEVMVIDSHADAWFDGAGDNADGLAVTIALARHFAKPANQPKRTLVFVASAGHHSAGMNGPRNFLAANPELAKRTVLVMNVEHVAQRNFSPARSTFPDGYRQTVADSGEGPISFGVTNSAPFLNDLALKGVERYGVNLISDHSTMATGETGGFAELAVPKITIMQAAPLYHTSGETLDVISTPGLERMAHFLAFVITQAASASRQQLGEARRERTDE